MKATGNAGSSKLSVDGRDLIVDIMLVKEARWMVNIKCMTSYCLKCKEGYFYLLRIISCNEPGMNQIKAVPRIGSGELRIKIGFLTVVKPLQLVPIKFLFTLDDWQPIEIGLHIAQTVP